MLPREKWRKVPFFLLYLKLLMLYLILTEKQQPSLQATFILFSAFSRLSVKKKKKRNGEGEPHKIVMRTSLWCFSDNYTRSSIDFEFLYQHLRLRKSLDTIRWILNSVLFIKFDFLTLHGG